MALLKKIADIQSGYQSRSKIEAREDGTHFLFQAKDLDSKNLTYETGEFVRFKPVLTGKDWVLRAGDILFMARGAKNYSVLIEDIPDAVLAAASFFIVRASSDSVSTEYIFWYLNQSPVQDYFIRYSGKGVHMPVVRRATLENLEIPVPPLETQKKIVETYRLMRKEQDQLKKLAEKRKTLLMAACLRAAQKR